MSLAELKTYLHDNNLLLVNRDALVDLVREANALQPTSKTVKWITVKKACESYGVTRYWLNAALEDPQTCLRVNAGKHLNSKKLYNEQSIIDEMERQAKLKQSIVDGSKNN